MMTNRTKGLLLMSPVLSGMAAYLLESEALASILVAVAGILVFAFAVCAFVIGTLIFFGAID